ncbi:RluA family pseudouridine synthase [Clostridium sp. E02]|uniref:RluA family pseudouridine synthase n=1 Tax=Clostridium sp. E02 TaxID=2487134 RepID=UPI001FAB1C0A|nr:RluA family pseudouridine synthase [Clostridium sp. E02]
MKNMTMTYTNPKGSEPITVHQLLLDQGYSQSLIRQLRKTQNGITLSGNLVFTTYVLKPGDELTVLLQDDSNESPLVPTPVPIHIEYEDEHLMVIYKEAGIPVHPSQGNRKTTLANGLAYYFKNKGEAFTSRIINRLDRDTTGLLIVAKHSLSACILYDMMKRRAIHRRYLAIVCGKLPQQGWIHTPIARAEGSIIKRCVQPLYGENASTFYKTLYYDPKTHHSLAEIQLETGRTHQIRVHLASIGHPIPGDFLYHPDYHYITRQALHSYRLDFLHPIDKTPLSFLSDLPKDMQFMGISSIDGL